MPEKKQPPYPVNPLTRAINLPSDVVHELFHLAHRDKAEAVRRVMALTDARLPEAQDYVEALDRRR